MKDKENSQGSLQIDLFGEKSGKTRASSLPGELCRHFSLDEIKTATDNFNKELIVGVGGFGHVYKGFIDEGNSRSVVIKRLCVGSKQGVEQLRTETLLLCQIPHVHLIPLIGYCNDEGEMILVYDFMANNILREHLYDTDKAPLLWKQRLQICIGVACGLHYLHTGLKHTVIHRDVKTTNILLDDKWVAKVSDFGSSKQVLNYDIKFSNLVVDDEVTSWPLDIGLSEQIPSSTAASYNFLSGKRVPWDLDNIGVITMEVQWNLANWARKCNENGSIGKIIDPYLEGKIAPECFKVYVEIAMACVQDQGIQRPTMVDVMEKLELALELQEKADAERPVEDYDLSAWKSGMSSDSGRTTYSDIMEDKENSQGSLQIDLFGGSI
ncbi:hypothetical protein F2P56_003911 [Juglans regia]|uniref:Protein kinase domain-containing protein n=1 Tax=Juglans regia TaxID=51240 RepID=A0A834D5U1_JUGRE|nr:hypothetical protein F2P56_003911 [Juglans regia]